MFYFDYLTFIFANHVSLNVIPTFSLMQFSEIMFPPLGLKWVNSPDMCSAAWLNLLFLLENGSEIPALSPYSLHPLLPIIVV